MRTFRFGALCSLSLAVSMSVAAVAAAQEKVGVATTVVGPVTVARASRPPEPLKFKDDVFLKDRITTGDDAITRILLGGKVVVTARERSTLVITEVPGRSTVDLSSGRIAVAVDRTRMKPGERVEVRTPNAIAGVRGTVFVVEAQGTTSTVTVLKGLVEVTRLDPATGQALGPVTAVAKHEAVTVRSNVLPAHPQTISAERAERLSREFSPPVRPVEAAAVMPVHEELTRAAALLKAMLPEASNVSSTSPAAGAPVDSAAASRRRGVMPTANAVSTRTDTVAVVSGTAPTLTGATPTVTSAVPTLTSTTPTLTPTPVPTATQSTSAMPGLLQGILQPVLKPVSGLL